MILLGVTLLCTDVPGQTSEMPEWCKSQPSPAYKSLKRVELPDQNWFEVYEIRPGVFAIYEPRQFEEVISYLILGKQKSLLFDTGMGISSIRKVVSQLTSSPVVVLNSHTHPDHIGGNHEFENILALNTSFTHKNAAGYRDPEMKKLVRAPNICGPIPADFNPENYAIAPFHISRFVSDSETLDLGGRKLQVLVTPGHTPDSLCLFDSANKLLFTGDTFYLGPIYLFSPETDRKSYQKSVARLSKLSNRIDLLLPAHNVPIASPAYLKKLSAAVDSVKNGSVKGLRTNEGLMEYSFENFSLLVQSK